jgi:predicted kinase
MEADSPYVIMMVGVPGSGKSTWVKNYLTLNPDVVVASTDRIIEKYAFENGTTYNAVFNTLIKDAEKMMNEDIDRAIQEKKNIIWDQTNLNVKTRFRKLSRFPFHYYRYAVFMETPSSVDHKYFLNSAERAGKDIPENILESMINSIQPPTVEEGFDRVYILPPIGNA